MAKKKKHKHSSYPKTSGGSNSHHICWQRRKWDYGDLKRLRSHPYCIVDIPANTLHRAIHEGMRQIPPPSQEGAARALGHLHYLEKYGGIKPDDPLEKRLSVMIALFDCSEQETADGFRKQLKIVREFNQKPS